MAGFSSQTTDSATTPNRFSNVFFDLPEKSASQPAYSMERWYEKIQHVEWPAPSVTSYNTVFLKGTGWRLASALRHSSTLHELGVSVVSLTVPSGFVSFNTWCQSDQQGVLYAGSVAATGDAFYKKNFAAGTNLSDPAYQLVGDQASFPTVTSALGAENSPMYRVGVTSAITTPQELYFSFKASGNPVGSQDHLTTFYFNGPQGWLPNILNSTNTGYYALVFRGDGQCNLCVYLTNSGGQVWVRLKTMRYAPKNQVMNRVHRVGVCPVVGLYPLTSAGSILFDFSTPAANAGAPAQGSYTDGILRSGFYTGDGDTAPFQVRWNAPGQFGTAPPFLGAVRVDARMDSDVQFQVCQTIYENTGVLLDAPFALPFLPDTSQPLTPFFWAIIPPGCSIAATLYEVDANPGGPPDLTNLGTAGSGSVSLFPVESKRFYCVKFTLSGPGDGSATPILLGYRIQRNSVGVIVDPGIFSPVLDSDVPPGSLRSSYYQNVDITLADNFPSTAQATCKVIDLDADCPGLQERGDFPAGIEGTFTDGDGTHSVWYHRGYAVMPESEPIGDHTDGGWNTGIGENGDLQNFNYGNRFDVDIQMAGAWQRLQEALLPVRFNLAILGNLSGVWNPYAPAIPKATDVIRQLFYFAGYGDDQLSIPNLSIKIFPGADGEGLVLEPQTNISEVIRRLCHDYIGGWIYHEPNLGTYGTWMLLQPVTGPDFNYVAAFTPASPGEGLLQNSIESYSTTSFDGQDIPQYPMFRRSVRWKQVPPEANVVLTYGASENQNDQGVQASCFLYNPDSFPFGYNGNPAPSPDHNVDWLSRPRWVYEYLPSWAQMLDSGTTALDWASRRIYDIACHGRLQRTFDSAVVIVKDTWSAADGTPFYRPARFYDIVLCEGVPCIIRSARIHYRKDYHQYATYTVEQILPDALAGTHWLQPSRLTPKIALRRAIKGLSLGALSESIDSHRELASEKRVYGMTADVFAMHALATLPSQNSDGSFKFLPGYDPV